MKRSTIIIISLVLILAVVAIILSNDKRHYNWEIGAVPTPQGEQPYDRDLFDEMMHRSLSNGYSVQISDTVKEPSHFYESSSSSYKPSLDALRKHSIDTAVLIIQSYRWECAYYDYDKHEDEEITIIGDDGEHSEKVDKLHGYAHYSIDVLKDLLYFASWGGQAVYVEWNNNIYSGSRTLIQEYLHPNESDFHDIMGSDRTSLQRLKMIEPNPVTAITAQGDSITLNQRFVFNPYQLAKDNFEYQQATFRGKKILVRPTLILGQNPDEAYGIEFYFPTTGGHLYITQLGPYFCNLGLVTPEGPQTISYFMSKFDDRPVVRLDYPKNVYGATSPSVDSPLLDKILNNRALHLSWVLMFVMGVLLVLRGAMRRYPVAKGVMADDLDKTDHMAARAYHLRQSPLLHFLFQTSWLYDGKRDYTSLYASNYRRLCRTVTRITGIELKTASDDDIKRAAKSLSARYGKDEKEAYEELKWMKEWADFSPISPRQFAESQRIAEQYPM